MKNSDKADILTWLNHDGGPLLLLPGEYLPLWEGINPPSHGRHVDAIFRWADPNSPATDYDRLCDICDAVDYLGVVSVGDGKGLVLTGTPVQTTAW